MIRILVAIAAAGAVLAAKPVHAQPLTKSTDIPKSLTGVAGDPEHGRQLAWARDRGNCVACHVIPAPDVTTHGNVGPPLKGPELGLALRF